MQSFLTEDMASAAIDLAMPSVHMAVVREMAKRGDMHIIVAIRDTTGKTAHGYQIMAEASLGNRKAWEHDYETIALSKARITARTGLPSREVQSRPELLLPTDVKFWGSVISGDIIVACSGVQPWYDEAFAGIILAFCLAQIQELVEDLRANSATDFYDD